MNFNLLSNQSGGIWVLKEPDDIEIGDELPRDETLEVESLGVKGVMQWSLESEFWIVYWEGLNDAPKGACLTVDYEPDEKEEEPQPEFDELKEIKDCDNIKDHRLVLLDNCIKLLGMCHIIHY